MYLNQFQWNSVWKFLKMANLMKHCNSWQWVVISAFTESDPIWPFHQFDSPILEAHRNLALEFSNSTKLAPEFSVVNIFQGPSEYGKGGQSFCLRISFKKALEIASTTASITGYSWLIAVERQFPTEGGKNGSCDPWSTLFSGMRSGSLWVTPFTMPPDLWWYEEEVLQLRWQSKHLLSWELCSIPQLCQTKSLKKMIVCHLTNSAGSLKNV